MISTFVIRLLESSPKQNFNFLASLCSQVSLFQNPRRQAHMLYTAWYVYEGSGKTLGLQPYKIVLFCLIWFCTFHGQSTIFQLCWDGSSWVEGHNSVTLVLLKPATPRSWVKHSTTEPLHSHPPAKIAMLVCLKSDLLWSVLLSDGLIQITIVNSFRRTTSYGRVRSRPSPILSWTLIMK